MNKNWDKLLKISIVILLCLNLIAHFTRSKPPPQLPVPTVIVQKPALKNRVDYLTQTGNTVAFNSVDLVARVAGYLDSIEFTDGTFVKKGAPLFVIEPEPYMDQLREAKATVMAQKAMDDYAKAEYARQKRMYKENATSLNNVEKWLAKSHESKADVDKALANEDSAAITYQYTHVVAPFDGRMGRHLIDKGNLVGNGTATTLATIQQLDPIYVYFHLNELDLIQLRQATRAQKLTEQQIQDIPVEVRLQNEAGFPHHGTLDFVNTGLDSSTGTMEFRAILPNKDYALLPGLFVQVRVAITKPSPQLIIPDTSVLYDQIGPYVLIVDKTNRVVLKRVVLGGIEAGERAISKGLEASDFVIISGLQQATPGHLVVPNYETKTQ